MVKIEEINAAEYSIGVTSHSVDCKKYEQENELLRKAKTIVEQRFKKQLDLEKITSVSKAMSFVTDILKFSNKEEFWVLFLASDHCPIHVERMSKGTINRASVYPRTVMEMCITLNAATVILVHNHPSGDSRASDADKRVTRDIQDALNFIDIGVLDHIIVSGNDKMSFANEGLL